MLYCLYRPYILHLQVSSGRKRSLGRPGTLGVSVSSSFSSPSSSSRLVGDISLEQTYHRIPPPRLLERDVFARVGFTRARVLVARVFALAQRRVASFCPSMLADVAGALHAAERAARVSSSVS